MDRLAPIIGKSQVLTVTSGGTATGGGFEALEPLQMIREIIPRSSAAAIGVAALSDDLAEASLPLLSKHWSELTAALQPPLPLVNGGARQDLPARGLIELVVDAVGFEGDGVWDASKPDGTPQKCLDVSRIAPLGWRARISLRKGIGIVHRDFTSRAERGGGSQALRSARART